MLIASKIVTLNQNPNLKLEGKLRILTSSYNVKLSYNRSNRDKSFRKWSRTSEARLTDSQN